MYYTSILIPAHPGPSSVHRKTPKVPYVVPRTPTALRQPADDVIAIASCDVTVYGLARHWEAGSIAESLDTRAAPSRWPTNGLVGMPARASPRIPSRPSCLLVVQP